MPTPPVQALSALTVTIDQPVHQANVPGNGTFKTFGWCAPNAGTTKSASITDGTQTWNGTSTAVPFHTPTYHWGFKFQGLPLNVPLTLTVTAQNGSDVASQSIEVTCV